MTKISIVIPTYNRPESLLRLLESLAAQQDVDWEAGEVLVVDDGSSVSYAAVLSGRDWPFELRLLQQENGGEARARNTGAAQARGELLLFLDDDMELLPDYVAAMGAEQERRQDWILIGNMQTPVETDGTMFQRVMAEQLTPTVFGEVPFTAILAGVLGMSAALYQSLGGMRAVPDAERGRWTDLDFGYRAAQQGIDFWRVEGAGVLHHDVVAQDLETACQRAEYVAFLAVRLFALHPRLAHKLPMFSDILPLNWRQDGARLGLRKVLRRCSATLAATWLLKVLIRGAERWGWLWALRPLYRWALGACLYRGYQAGVDNARRA